MKNGKPIVHFKSDEFAEMKQKNAKLVIGSFVGRRPDYNFVKSIVSTTWKLKNTFSMKAYGQQSFSFEFGTMEDRVQALSIGSFHIASQIFIVRPWKLFIEADLHQLKSMLVWVLFKKVPMELWDKKGFSKIGSAVGKPLFTDKFTEEMRRTNYARICIEVEADCKYEEEIQVVIDDEKEFTIPLEYNWRPPRCSSCKNFGHSDVGCASLKAVNENQRQVDGGISKARISATPLVDLPGKEDGFIQVRNRRGRGRQQPTMGRSNQSVGARPHIPQGSSTLNAKWQRIGTNLENAWNKGKSKNDSTAANVATKKEALNRFEVLSAGQRVHTEEAGSALIPMENNDEQNLSMSSGTIAEGTCSKSRPDGLESIDLETIDKSTTRGTGVGRGDTSLPSTSVAIGANNSELLSNSDRILQGLAPIFQDQMKGKSLIAQSLLPVKYVALYPNGDSESDYGNDSEGEKELFTDHIMKEKTQQNTPFQEARRSSKDKKEKNLGDEWVTPMIKKKTFKVECNSLGEVEPNLVMIKKFDSISKRTQKFSKREDFIAEIKDDTLGVTFGCKDCGAFYISKEKLQWHLGRDHAAQVQKLSR